MSTTAVHRGSLRTRAIKAGTWSGAGFVGAQMLRLVSSLVLTRLLTPDLFGLMAITTIVQTIFGLLSDVGLRQSVVQNPRGNEPAFLNTIWCLQILRGGFIWVFSTLTGVVLYLLDGAGLVSPGSVYANDLLPVLLFATGAVVFVHTWHSPKALVQQRDLQLRGVTVIDLLTQALGLAVTLLCAWYSRSIWAIFIGGFFSSFTYVLLTHRWLPGHKARLQWNPQIAREVVRFGRWIVVSSTLGILASNADRLLLGSWVSPDVLGFYSLALSLLVVVFGAGDRVLSGIIFPMLSEAIRESPERFRTMYRKLRLPVDLAFLVISGGLFASAEWIIRLLFDPRYESAGYMLQILALTLVPSRYSLAHNAYLAAGKTAYLSALNAVLLVSTWVLITTLYHFFGLPGALIGIALKSLPTVPLVYYFNAQLGLNDWKLELLPLLAWPAGYGAGYLLTSLMSWVR